MTEYRIPSERREQLLRDGYTLLPNAVPDSLLARWRDLASALEAAALQAHGRAEQLHGACVIEDPAGPRVMRYDDVLGADPDAALDLLACPAMMAVARELCGRGAVPMYMDLLYKHQHPHPVILWHQGAQHPRGYPYLNVGLYLDDADAGDGCLRYVPGTQNELQDIAGLAKEYGWDIPGSVEQPARAGDILVQDMMVLHGSQPKRSPNPRRTVYVEIRPTDGIAESGAQSAGWAALRARWMAMVVRRAAATEWPDEWHVDLPSDLRSDADEIASILANPEPPIPAVYCVHPVETDDYPVPADLRDA